MEYSVAEETEDAVMIQGETDRDWTGFQIEPPAWAFPLRMRNRNNQY